MRKASALARLLPAADGAVVLGRPRSTRGPTVWSAARARPQPRRPNPSTRPNARPVSVSTTTGVPCTERYLDVPAGDRRTAAAGRTAQRHEHDDVVGYSDPSERSRHPEYVRPGPAWPASRPALDGGSEDHALHTIGLPTVAVAFSGGAEDHALHTPVSPAAAAGLGPSRYRCTASHAATTFTFAFPLEGRQRPVRRPR